MIDVHKTKVSQYCSKVPNMFIFTDEFGYAQLSLNFIASEYGIDYDNAKKVCIINNGFTKDYYGHWFFKSEDDANSALMMLKLMR